MMKLNKDDERLFCKDFYSQKELAKAMAEQWGKVPESQKDSSMTSASSDSRRSHMNESERLTHECLNGIKEGYWSAKKKDELIQKLGQYEDLGYSPEELAELISKVKGENHV